MRSMSAFGSCVVLVAFATPIASPATPSRADEPDRAEVRETLKQLWDSLDTLEFQVETMVLDRRGEPDTKIGGGRTEFAFGSGGRRASKTWRIEPGLKDETVVSESRLDGRRGCHIVFFPGSGGVIDNITISPQITTHEDSPTTVNSASWLLTPFGKPLFSYVDEGAELSRIAAGEDEGCVALTTKVRGNTLRLVLDPAHDWFPKRASVGKVMDAEVMEFGRDSGRWFPVECVDTTFEEGEVKRTRSRVENLRINRPIPDARFAPPPFEAGMLVADRSSGTAKIVGGDSARKALLERHGSTLTTIGQRSESPVSAARAPRASRWPWIVGVTAVGFIVVAIALARRSRGA